MFGKAPTRTTVVCALSATARDKMTAIKISNFNFTYRSGDCRVQPWAIGWLGSFSDGAFRAATASDLQYQRSWCSPGFWRRRRGREEKPGKGRGEPRRGQSK